jgi:hypothetical protein
MSNKYRDITHHICQEIEELLQDNKSVSDIGWFGRSVMCRIKNNMLELKVYLVAKKAREDNDGHMLDSAIRLNSEVMKIDSMIDGLDRKIRTINN